MSKKENNDYFIYHNKNFAGLNTGDCWFRAIAIVLGIEEKEVIKESTEIFLKTGYAYGSEYMTDEMLYDRRGWSMHIKPEHPVVEHEGDSGEITLKEFIDCLRREDYWFTNQPFNKKKLVVLLDGWRHATAVINTFIIDTFDCSHMIVEEWYSADNEPEEVDSSDVFADCDLDELFADN